MGKEYFSHDTDSLSDIKIVKMMADYGYTGFGYYWAILAELYKNGGRYALEDLEILAKIIGVDVKRLKSFIIQATDKYTHNGVGLFCRDEKEFWSNSLLNRMELREKKSIAAKKPKAVEKKIDPFINKFNDLFINEYRKVFDTKPFLSKQDGERLIELATDYDNLEELLPDALNKLKEINFEDINFKPTASWLLKGNNFERVLNGEFENKTMGKGDTGILERLGRESK